MEDVWSFVTMDGGQQFVTIILGVYLLQLFANNFWEKMQVSFIFEIKIMMYETEMVSHDIYKAFNNVHSLQVLHGFRITMVIFKTKD